MAAIRRIVTDPPGLGCLLVWFALSATTVQAGDIARGVVFADTNSNGQRDAGEPGLAGAVVSNQEDVVVTDGEGRYSLPVGDDTVIFVVKPTGYALPRGPRGLPQFFHIHRPQGSPPLHYGGVPPTGPLPDSLDFPLHRAPESDEFAVVALADPQPETSQEVQYVRDDVLAELVGCGAAAGVVLGDIASDHLDLYGGYVDSIRQIGFPVFHVIGNHDMNYDAADDRDSDDTFLRVFGPNYYSWNQGRVHFVALDSVTWLGPGKGNGNYRGEFGERQLRWLAADLAHVPAEHLVVLFMHIPFSSPDGRDCVDKDQLLEVLRDRARVLAVAGHAHFQEHTFLGPEQGWNGPGELHQLIAATVSGSWWSGPKDIRGIPVADGRDGVPNGYAILSFRGAEYTTAFKAAGLGRDYQMRIYPPGSLGLDKQQRMSLLVNVFDGSARSRVEYSLDSAEYRPMTQTTRTDPLAEALLTGVFDTGKPWGRPWESRHLWSAQLAEELQGGTHLVTVRVTDHHGRVHQQSRLFVP